MFKCMTLPKGASEELNFPMEIKEKILNGLPLWDEEKKKNTEDDDEEEQEAQKGEKKLTQDQKYLMEMFGEGRYHIIPSFFRTIIFLKKQKREFAVVFRTFGDDLNKVTWEFNKFCEGNHPCFSGRNGTPLIKFDGSKGTKDMRIKADNQKATFYRFSSEIEDTKLVQGSNVRQPNNFDQLQDFLLKDENEHLTLHQDHLSQYLAILNTL